MKRFVALLLACVMMFALCGSSFADNETKKKIPVLHFSSFYEEYEINEVVAKAEYIGESYKMRAYVSDIKEDFVTFVPANFLSSESKISIKVPLTFEDIKKLSINQVVDISGQIESISEEIEILRSVKKDTEIKNITFTLNNNYTMEDIIKIFGDVSEIEGLENSRDGKAYLEIIEHNPYYNRGDFAIYSYRDEAELVRINSEQAIEDKADVAITAKASFSNGMWAATNYQFYLRLDSIETIKIY